MMNWFKMRRSVLLFPFLAVLLVLEGGLPSTHVGQMAHTTVANQELSAGFIASGVLAYQPAYPLSVVVPVFEVRNAPDLQRIIFPPSASFYSFLSSTPYGYQQLSKFLLVSLTGVDIIFPFHTFW